VVHGIGEYQQQATHTLVQFSNGQGQSQSFYLDPILMVRRCRQFKHVQWAKIWAF